MSVSARRTRWLLFLVTLMIAAISCAARVTPKFAASDQGTFEQIRNQFLDTERARLDAQNAKVLARIERIRTCNCDAARRAISDETARLQQRYKTASGRASTKIERRLETLRLRLHELDK